MCIMGMVRRCSKQQNAMVATEWEARGMTVAMETSARVRTRAGMGKGEGGAEVETSGMRT
jgi:hypothetical protein